MVDGVRPFQSFDLCVSFVVGKDIEEGVSLRWRESWRRHDVVCCIVALLISLLLFYKMKLLDLTCSARRYMKRLN